MLSVRITPVLVLLAGLLCSATGSAQRRLAALEPGASERGPAASAGVLVHHYDQLHEGEHWRVVTPRGPVHLFRPSDHDPTSAGIVVFMHGHGTTADRSWTTARLASQFAASRANALCVVPEGPQRAGEPVVWPRLDELLVAAAGRAGIELPAGPVVLVGHSSGFHSVTAWMSDPRVVEVILLDGLYGREEELAAWLATSRSHRLILVAERSRSVAEAWVRLVPGARELGYVPRYLDELTLEERAAPVLYLRSQVGHSEMVTGRAVLPLVLSLTRLAASQDRPRP